MPSAYSIMLRRKGFVAASFLITGFVASAQDNSPYSRYGLGDVVPNTHIVNRGMAGISAAYQDFLSVNFNNPASYSAFQTRTEQRSGRGMDGRVLLDVGINFENRTLRQPNTTNRFTAPNALFSYVHFGIPLKRNWGLSFGLRPISRIGYRINRRDLVVNPPTGSPIDSAITQFTGSGGTFLPSIGTGYAYKNLSVGASVGYLFGKRESTTTLNFINDSINYQRGRVQNQSSFGGLFINAGVQYKIAINNTTNLRLGASGNLQQTLKGTQDVEKSTFISTINGDVVQDTVQVSSVSGEVVYPAQYTLGFILDRTNEKLGGWLVGADVVLSQWDGYRFFGAQDAVKNTWQLRVGGQYRPDATQAYFSNVSYRLGFFTGPDYITAAGELPHSGVTLGFGLPIANRSRLSPFQYSILNLAFEVSRRGNNNNSLRENMFRLSAGFSLSDLWFAKRRYD